MATRREDNPKGRMLFTDFDASSKGRPTVPFADEQSAGPHLPTLADLVSTLEFDFEDDDGAPSGDGQPSWASLLQREAETTLRNQAQGTPETAHSGSGSHQNPPTEMWVIKPSAIAEMHRKPAKTPDAPDTAIDSDAPDTHDVFPPEPFARRGEGDDGGGDSESATRILSRQSAETNGEADAGTAGGEADDDDILSALSGMENDSDRHPLFEPEDRERRLGVSAPRPTPYGGITRLREWYRPPEQEPEGDGRDAVKRETDWYEPPDTDVFNAVDADLAPPDGAEELDAGRPGDDTRARSRSGTTTVDIFGNIDIDSLWEERTRDRQERAENAGTDGSPPSMTQTLLHHPAEPDNNSTVILSADDIMADSAIQAQMERPSASSGRFGVPPPPDLLPPHEDRRAIAESRLEKELEKKAGKTPRKKPEAPLTPSKAAPEAELEPDILAEAPIAPEAAPPPAKPARKSAPETRTQKAPPKRRHGHSTKAELAAMDNLDIDALLGGFDFEADINADVERPVISDADISTVTMSGSTPKTAAKKAPATATPDADEESALDLAELLDATETGTPAGSADIEPPATNDDHINPLDAAEAPEPAVAADAEPEDYIPEREPGAGFDDAYDDDGGDASDGISDEMPDGADGDDNADSEGGKGSKGDSGEAQPEGESGAEAAVDPMDVFANMDDMDFSDDGLDDDMKAMLDDDESLEDEDADSGEAGTAVPVAEETPPEGRLARILFFAGKRIRSNKLAVKLTTMVGWRENWWFYVDLLAAVVTSASLAVILSYWIWYRK